MTRWNSAARSGMFLRKASRRGLPLRLPRHSPRDRSPEMIQGLLGDVGRRFHRPAQGLLGQPHFFLAQRLAVGR